MTALPKQIEKRLEQAGLRYDIPTLHLVSDIMGICAIEASSWINHWADADELPWPDAVRIPDLLRDTSNALRSSAKKLDVNATEASEAADRCWYFVLTLNDEEWNKIADREGYLTYSLAIPQERIIKVTVQREGE